VSRPSQADGRGEAEDPSGRTMAPPSLTPFAALAINAALAVIGVKLLAWHLTGSVGLFSDALESVANLAGAIMALAMLRLASRPPDDEHAYGHTKAEYFSSGFEGALIFAAGVAILWAAIPRFWAPQPLESIGVGLVLAAIAAVMNAGVAVVLLRAGRRYGSITLEAGGHHLLTDVWTSVGVIVGVGLVGVTDWLWLDPLLAVGVAVHIAFMGVRLLRRSTLGLLDTALPEGQLRRIEEALAAFEARGIEFHALRTRRAGRRSFISLHVLVPGEWTVQRGHDLAEEVEDRLMAIVPGSNVFTHLEPVEDPASFRDTRIAPIDPAPLTPPEP
jgi:cation diffusion facilitator family transporter